MEISGQRVGGLERMRPSGGRIFFKVAHLVVDRREVILEILSLLVEQVIQESMTQAIQTTLKILMELISTPGKK